MRTFTRADVISWGPCYGEAGVRRLAKGMPKRCTALDVLAAQHISADDRLWVCLRETVLSDKTLRLFAVSCARRALESERAAGREPNEWSWTAVDTAERHAHRRATDEELDDAHRNAWGYAVNDCDTGADTRAWAASTWAAYVAAWSAWSAIDTAARMAAADATRSANARGTAHETAERDWQVTELVRLIHKEEV